MRIPSTPARTLSGLDVRVPDDFIGARNAVLFIFERNHLAAVPAWQAVLQAALADASAGFYILIPIDTAPAWRRPMTNWALRLEIADDAIFEDTAVLWCNRRRWRAAVGLPGFNEPLLAIASPDGDIHAIAPGLPNPAVTTRLISALGRTENQ